jgi:hypothetical protein
MAYFFKPNSENKPLVASSFLSTLGVRAFLSIAQVSVPWSIVVSSASLLHLNPKT